MNIYDINSAYKLAEDRLFATVNDYGELDAEALEAFQNIALERDTAIEACILSDKNDKAFLEALDAEIKALQNRKKTVANRIEWREGYLTTLLDGNKFETAKAKASFRKSDRVTIISPELIPDEYNKVQIKSEPDKALIKTAIKSGKQVAGASLDTFLNIQIK